MRRHQLPVLLLFLMSYSIQVESRPSPSTSDNTDNSVDDKEWRSMIGQDPTNTHEESLGAFIFRPGSRSAKNRAKESFREGMENRTHLLPEDENLDPLSLERINPHVLRIQAPIGDNNNVYHGDGHNDDNEETDDDLPPIDPTNPEEIERKKMYRIDHQDVFDRILEINKGEEGKPALMEGDIAALRVRNAAGILWPKTKYGSRKGLAVIPYKIASIYNSTEVQVIKSAMELYTKHTCIRFAPRTRELAYILISDGKGCWAYVGRTGYSAQTVSLGIPGCVAKGIAAHELMHVVGFQHEHSRSDRDNYVTILEHNIQKEMRTNFEKYNNTKNLVIYDYNSVMHYSRNAFAKFQYLPAIQIKPKRKPEPTIGQRERMSPYDIEEIKYLYNCAQDTYTRCGRDFINANTGSFTSPMYPNNYPSESHCTWKITVPKGIYVAVTFKNIDIEDSPLCQKDAILIHDGENAAAARIKAICGNKKVSTTIISTGNSMFIMFTSNPKSTSKGFEATFKRSYTSGVIPTPPEEPKLLPVDKVLSQFHCEFEKGICDMKQDQLDELDWLRLKGPTTSVATGPTSDHTSGSGYYMYVESSLPSKVGDNAILRTPWMSRNYQSCITFSYHMYGSYMGTLRLYAYEKRKNDDYGHEVLLWEKHGHQGNRWRTQEVPYHPDSTVERVQYYLEAFVFFYLSDIGIDDLHIRNEACPSLPGGTTPRVEVKTLKTTQVATTSTIPTTTTTTTKATTTTTQPPTTTTKSIENSPISSITCDFESGLCGWTQPTSDNFNWQLSKTGTPSHNTGPATDHTTGRGYFLYIEASTPRIANDVARLLSPRLTRKQHCLKLWYHMYGAQMGALAVYQITDGVETKLMEKVGNKGDNWFYAEVDVITPAVKSSSLTNAILKNEAYTQVAIDGIRGSGYPGDMAIDDIKITASPCASSTLHPAATNLITSISCNFDTAEDLCGFTDSDTDNFDWTQHSGTTPSASTGPDVDHTKGDISGKYMYIEASSPRAKGDKARFTSPKLTSGRYCVNFYIHMWGSGTGSINVYTLEYAGIGNTITKKQWEMSGAQGKNWISAEFQFETALNIRYVQLEFEAVIGPSFTSDSALDDIHVTSGLCTKKQAVTTTVKNSARTVGLTQTTTIKATTIPVIKPTTTASTTKKTSKATTRPITTRRTRTTTIATTSPSTSRRNIATTTVTTPTTKATTKATTKTTIRATAKRITVKAVTTDTTKATTAPPKATTQSKTTMTTKTTTPPKTTKATAMVTKTASTSSPTTTQIKSTAKEPRSTARKRPTPRSQKPSTTKPTMKRTTTGKSTARTTTRPISKSPPKKPAAVVKTHPHTTRPGAAVRPISNQLRNRQKTQTTIQPATSKAVSVTKPALYPTHFECDFESGDVCGLKQSNVDNFDWQIHSGNTSSSGTGPTDDHTHGPTMKGRYLYIEGSNPRAQNHKAVIVTPSLSAAPEERCLEFWYHMYGNGIGQLKVYSEFSKTGNFKKVASSHPSRMRAPQIRFQVRGDQGNEWKLARIPITSSLRSSDAGLRIYFEGVRGNGFKSDIAIDDICISSQQCGHRSSCWRNAPTPKPTKNTTTKTPIITPSVKNLVSLPTVSPESSNDPLRDLAIEMKFCTFDTPIKKSKNNRDKIINDVPIAVKSGIRSLDLGRFIPQQQDDSKNVMCGWEQEKVRDKFDWSRKSGSTPSGYTGPNSDHTGKGYYLFIESSVPRLFNDAAILKSKIMYPTDYCVDLFYSMYGNGIGSLLVRSQQKLDNGRQIVQYLKALRGEQGETWGRLQATYEPKTNVKSVQFRIEGIRGKDYMGDIAIDDVRVVPGICDACLKPNQRFTNNWGHTNEFSTGCINEDLFFVRCCSLSTEKVVYRRVKNCALDMYEPNRLNWMCRVMSQS